MRRLNIGFRLWAAFVLAISIATASDEGLVAWWAFDEGEGEATLDSASAISDPIQGNFRHIGGARGSALKFDGFTTRIIRPAGKAPRIRSAFTVEAWVAPQAYPWSWCAIANQERDHEAGWFFGLDELGHIGLHVAVGGKWRVCRSGEGIPFMEAWSHVAGTFDPSSGITIYINGQKAGRLSVKGKMNPARGVELQIGRNQTLLPPAALVREDVAFSTSCSFDGIVDELKIYNRALTAEEIERAYRATKPEGPPSLEWRKLPRVTGGPRRFGAVHTRLEFYQEWDALWPVADHPDIIVNFDEIDGKMVFWRGTNYNMNLVTENGRWVGDQSGEGGFGDVIGCCEHMSDKQCRYTHVRMIENHDARVVVHWRYALNDVLYRIASTDPITGWGDWADEYYYIYPDGVATRFAMIHGSADAYSLTEPATYNQPGEKAEDNVDMAAATLANMEGVIRTYTWDPWPGSGRIAADFDNPVPNANIDVVNFKSTNKPFYIYEPGVRIIPYGGGLVELRSEYSHFPTWNHWPVSQAPSDGRFALAPDRVSSSAILSPEPPMKREREGGPLEARFIMGLTDQPIEKLAPLARSWLQAPDLQGASAAFKVEGYCRNERAFILYKETDEPAALEFRIAASEDSPVVNPAFVIHNWGDADVRLKIDGLEIPQGRNFRYGHHYSLEGTDLVVWIRKESFQPIQVSLVPAGG